MISAKKKEKADYRRTRPPAWLISQRKGLPRSQLEGGFQEKEDFKREKSKLRRDGGKGWRLSKFNSLLECHYRRGRGGRGKA